MLRNKRFVNLLAWRLFFRARLQSTLVVAVIALPVAIGVTLAVASATSRPTTDERLTAFMGSADARLQSQESADGSVAYVDPFVADSELSMAFSPAVKRSLDLDLLLTIKSSRNLILQVQTRGLDLSNLALADIYSIRQGRQATEQGEITLSQPVATRLSVSVGEQVSVGDASLTVVGIVYDSQDLDRNLAVVVPASFSPGGVAEGQADQVGSARWYLSYPASEFSDVSRVVENEGLALTTRTQAVLRLDPDPVVDLAATGVTVGLLIQAALMAAAAFIVVIETQRRNIGLLAALGASHRVRRAVVRRYALLTALVASAIGVVTGQIVALAAIPILEESARQEWGNFEAAGGTTVVLVALAIAAAQLAVFFPAREASRAEIVKLLRSAGDNRFQKGGPTAARRAGLALGLLALSTACVWWSAQSQNPALLVLGSTAAAFCVGSVMTIGVTARVQGDLAIFGPVVRSVLRSLTSNSARLLVLTSACAVVVATGYSYSAVVSSTVEYERLSFVPELPPGSALVTAQAPLTPRDLQALRSTPTGSAAIAFSPAITTTSTPIGEAYDTVMIASPLMRCLEAQGELIGVLDTASCSGDGKSILFPTIGIASVESLGSIAGAVIDVQARSVLAQGGAAVLSNSVLSAGDSVDLVRPPRLDDVSLDSFIPLGTLPAVAVASDSGYSRLPQAFITPETAVALGFELGEQQILLPRAQAADDAAIRSALPVSQQASALIEQARDNSELPALELARVVGVVAAAALSATVIAAGIALWNAESRAELSRFAVVGATRRRILQYSLLHGVALALLSCLVAVLPAALATSAFLRIIGTPASVSVLDIIGLVAATIFAAGVGAVAVRPRGVSVVRDQT